MKLFTAPDVVDHQLNPVSVFLAGSIEMDKAENWQQRIESELADLDVSVINPRRAEWDSSWVQHESNPQFLEQVNWELDNLKKASIVFFYFDPKTKSPVSLMELGYVLGMKPWANRPVIVVCPESFWRSGNVSIMCNVARVPVSYSLEDGVKRLRAAIIKDIANQHEDY